LGTLAGYRYQEVRVSHRSLAVPALALAALVACDKVPDLSIGAKEGIPPIQGSTVIDVPQDFVCGGTIADPDREYTITTTGTQSSCTFTFAQDVTALASADYAKIPGLEGAQVINRVDLEVTTLGVTDASTGQPLAIGQTLLDFKGTAFGASILTKEDLSAPVPFTRSIDGAPLDAVKDQVKQQADIVIPVVVVAVVKLDPEPPAQIGLDFDAQPSLVVGF
jgi:hypothetical protein